MEDIYLEDYIQCAVCGINVVQRGNNQKYCDLHAIISRKERSKINARKYRAKKKARLTDYANHLQPGSCSSTEENACLRGDASHVIIPSNERRNFRHMVNKRLFRNEMVG